MQTKHDVARILSEAGLLPVKGPGQNFLVDGNLLRKMADLTEPDGRDTILEVGTGTGALTEVLAEKAGRVFTVDIDRRLQEAAARALRRLDNIVYINADILASKRALAPEVVDRVAAHLACQENPRLKIASNLPYNVATPFVINTLESELPVERMIVTVQREVAERLAASPGSSTYGVTSVIVSVLADVSIVHTISPNVFFPKPKVSGAILRIAPKSKSDRPQVSMAALRRLAETVFQHRRKQALGTVRHAFGVETLETCREVFARRSIASNARPQDLSPADYIELAKSAPA